MEYVPTKAVEDVIAERRRQVEGEGWTLEDDDLHVNGEMAMAAVCYAKQATVFAYLRPSAYQALRQPPSRWPWNPAWWKPKDRRRDLVRAAALIIAEIERLDRATHHG